MDLAKRMKMYEQMYTPRTMPQLPVLARIDGKGWHQWAKDLARPYDRGLMDIMKRTLGYLVQETQAQCGYSQSDEISLVYFTEDPKSKIYFDGKIQKLASVLASLCTAYFNTNRAKFIARTQPATFDCRVWQVPNLEEAANYLVWRELDAHRNSIQMYARSFFTQKELRGKKEPDIHEMLHSKGQNWATTHEQFKRGIYCIRKKQGEQRILRVACIPPILRISNRIETLFFGDDPQPLVDHLQRSIVLHNPQ